MSWRVVDEDDTHRIPQTTPSRPQREHRSTISGRYAERKPCCCEAQR